jgi:hypothetical protein
MRKKQKESPVKSNESKLKNSTTRHEEMDHRDEEAVFNEQVLLAI